MVALQTLLLEVSLKDFIWFHSGWREWKETKKMKRIAICHWRLEFVYQIQWKWNSEKTLKIYKRAFFFFLKMIFYNFALISCFEFFSFLNSNFFLNFFLSIFLIVFHIFTNTHYLPEHNTHFQSQLLSDKSDIKTKKNNSDYLIRKMWSSQSDF